MEKFIEKFTKEHPKTLHEMENQLGNPEDIHPIVSFDVLENTCGGNDILEHLFQEVVDYCERYTETVARFQEMILQGVDFDNREAKEWIDGERKIIHDAMIDSVNILARNMEKAGKDASWIKSLERSRAAYGNFAMQNTYKLLKEYGEQNGYNEQSKPGK